jgi:hypothetical protein
VEVAGTRLLLVALTVTAVVPVVLPKTLTGVADCVCPGLTVMLVGETLALDGSLLETSRNRVESGARDNEIGNGTESPGATEIVAGTTMSTGVLTVTLAVASAKFAALARITAEPGATPETATVAVLVLAAMVTVGEPTLATLVLLEVMLKVRPPAGAGPESVNVRFRVSVPASVRVAGEKLMVAVTWMAFVVEVYTGEVAVMFVLPSAFPVTSGATVG